MTCKTHHNLVSMLLGLKRGMFLQGLFVLLFLSLCSYSANAQTAPTLTGTATDSAFTIGQAAVQVFDNAVVTDGGDGAQTIVGFTVTVTNVNDGATAGDDEFLIIDGTSYALADDGTAGSGVAGSSSTLGSFTIAITLSTGTSTVQLSGLNTAAGISTADMQTVIDELEYNNTNGTPDANAHVITVTDIQDSGTVPNNAAPTLPASTVAINTAPTISFSGSALAYTENGAATVVDGTGITTDSDGDADWNGGTLSVQITTNNESDDEISFIATGGITVSGTELREGGTNFGTLSISGGVETDGNILSVTLNSSATSARVQSAIQALAYRSTSESPSELVRTITFTVTDNEGGTNNATRTVNVTAENDPPTLGNLNGNTPSFTEDAGAIDIDVANDVTVVDPDGDTEFNGGNVLVAFNMGLQALEDVLSVENIGTGAGEISVSGTTISYENNAIGDIDGTSDGAGANLQINFNTANATPAAVQALLRAVQYNNTSNTPNTTNRILDITVNDGNGGSATSTVSQVTLSVAAANDAPSVAASGGTTMFTEDGGAVAIDGGLTVSDVDDPDLNTGTVTISTAYNSMEDVLGFVPNVGTMGNITETSNTGGVITLTSSGGTATIAQWQAALRAVTYNNTSNDPNTTSRVMTFAVNDGALGSSATGATQTVSVTANNDAPSVAASGGTTAFTEDGGAVAIDGGLTVSDDDDPDLNTGTVTISTAYNSMEDVLGFVANAGTMGNIAETSNTGGVITLTSSGGTATIAQWQAALRAVTYNNTSDDPNTTSRVMTFAVNDGALGSSATGATQTVSVTAVNDAPDLNATSLNPTFTTSTSAAVDLYSSAAITDEAGQNIIGFIVELTNVTNQDMGSAGDSEKLIIDGTTISLNANSTSTSNFSSAVVTRPGSNVSRVTFTDATGVDATTFQGIIDGMQYRNDDSSPATANDRVVTIESLTDNGGGSNTNTSLTIGSSTVALTNTIPASLSTGDIIIIGFRGDGGDEVSWVPLVDISVGEVIYFTDAAWDGTAFLSSNSTLVRFIAPSAITKGTIQTFDNGSSGSGGYTFLSNTLVSNTTSWALSNSGDQVFVFQSDDAVNSSFPATYTSIFAATGHSQNWNTSGGNEQQSQLYPGITDVNGTDDTGVSAGAGTGTGDEFDNIRYGNGSALRAGTRSAILTAVGNDANWEGANSGTSAGYAAGGVAGNFIINELPVITNLDLDAINPYTEGDGAVVLDQSSDATLTDVDNANFNNGDLTVTITGGEDPAEDQLSFNTSGTIAFPGGTTSGSNVTVGGVVVGTLDNTVGVGADLIVSLNADATIARVQTLIRGITYENTDNVNPTEGARTIAVSLTDGTTGASATSAVSNVTVTVVRVNDAPTFPALTGSTPTYNENAAAITLFSGANVDPIETGQNFTQFIMTVTNTDDGADDRLIVDGSTINLNNAVSGTTTGGNSLGYTVANGSGTSATITFTGSISEANLETVINGIQYINNSENPSSSNTRVVTFTSLTDTDGTTPVTNSGISVANSTITIQPLNDPPVVTLAAAEQSTTTSTNITFSAANGNAITVDDAEGNTHTVTVTVTGGGTFTANTGGSASIGTNGTASVSIGGTSAEVIAAFEGSSFSPGTSRGSQSIAIQSNDGFDPSTTETINIRVVLDLNVGDIAFTAFDADDDDFAIVPLVDLNANDGNGDIEIRFTDNEWVDASDNFNSDEGDLVWTITAGSTIAAGTIITFENVNGSPTVSGGGGVAVTGTMDIAGDDEAIFAYTGYLSDPFDVITAVANDNPGFGATGATALTDAGLTEGTNAINLTSDFDFGQYNGSRTNQQTFLGFVGQINTASNWTRNNTGGVAITGTAFTTDNTPPVASTINRDAGQAAADNGSPVVFTVTFSEAVTDVEVGDFDITTTGSFSVLPTVSGVSPISTTVYDISVTSGTGTGDIRLDFLAPGGSADGVIDEALNVSTAARNGDEVVSFDNEPPTFPVTPVANNTTAIGFDIVVQLNEIGTVDYVVLDDMAAPPSAAQVDAGNDASGTNTNVRASGTINVTTASTNFTATLTTLMENTAYDVYVVGLDNLSNRQAAVTPIDVSTRPFDNDSDIVINSVDDGATPDIDYAANQQTGLDGTTGVSLLNLDVTDAGTADNTATVLTGLTFTITNPSYIRQLAVYDASDNELVEISNPTASQALVFTQNLTIADNTTETINVRASFNTTVTDNTDVVLALAAGTGSVTSGSGSTFNNGITGATSSTTGTDNQIEVTATQYAIVQQPTDVTVTQDITPAVTISANDGLGNRDLDYTDGVNDATITATGATLSGSPVDVAISAGFGTVTNDLIFTGATTNTATTLTISDGADPIGLTDVTSSSFTVRPLDRNSTAVIEPGGETDNILYDAHLTADFADITNTNGQSLATIRITDVSGSDQLPTIVDEIQISLSNHAFLGEVALFDGSGNQIGAEQTISAAAVTFSSLAFSVANNTFADLTLRGTFTTAVTDNAQIQVTLTSVTSTSTSSEVASSNFNDSSFGSTSLLTGDANRIEVVADRFAFTALDAAEFVTIAFSSTIQAHDDNGNRDLDNTNAYTLAINSQVSPAAPVGVLGGSTTGNLSAGQVALSDLTITENGTYTLSASGGLTSAISGNIVITTPDPTTVVTSSTTLDESGVVINSTDNASPISVFDFDVTDDGFIDGVATLITSVTIRNGSNSSADLADFRDFIGSATLVDDDTPQNSISGTVNATTITFTSIPTAVGDLGNVPNNTTKKYTLRITVANPLSSALQEAFDNKLVEFLIDDTDFTTGPSSSTFDPATTEVSSGQVDTEVTATQLVVGSQPSRIFVDFPFSITIEARDANGNLDLDETSPISVSEVTSDAGGSLTGSTSAQVLSAGTRTFSDLQVDAFDNTAPSYTFRFVDDGGGLTQVDTSPQINTELPDNASTITRNAGGEQTSQIEYINFQGVSGSLTTSNSVSVLGFTVTDVASTGDGIPTIINNITVTVTAGTASRIRAIGIYDGSTFLGEAAGGSTNTAIALSTPISVAQNTSENFAVYVSFNTSITDNEQFQFDILNSGITQPSTASSTIQPSNINATSLVASNENELNVTATKLTITSIDQVVQVNANFLATVQARDINDNVDLDFSQTVTATADASSTGLGGLGAIVTTGGIDTQSPGAGTGTYNFTTLQLDNGGIHAVRFTSNGSPTLSELTTSSASGNVNSTVTALFNTSDIIIDPGFTFPTFFNYTSYSEAGNSGTITFASAQSLEVAQYLVRDGGAGDDSDDVGTQVSSITFTLNGNAQDDVTALALFTGSGTQLGTQQTVSGSTVTFTGFTDLIGDTNDQTYLLKATFKQNTADITDNDQHQYTVSSITVDTPISGSAGSFAGSLSNFATATPNVATPIGSNENILDVVADRIVYTTDPTGNTYERETSKLTTDNLVFRVEARDAVGNLDTDETSVLSVAGTSTLGGTASLSATSVTLVAGVSPSTTIQVLNEHEDMTLTISDSDGNTGSRGGTLSTITNDGTATLIDVYDRTVPEIIAGSPLSPVDGAPNVSLATTQLTITFDEDVNFTSGNIVIQGNQTPIAQQIILDVTNSSEVSISGATVTLNIGTVLESGVDYYVIIPNNVLDDDISGTNVEAIGPVAGQGQAGTFNNFGGFLNATDWNFTTETVITIQSAAVTNTNEVTLTFNENIDINGGDATVRDFFILTQQGGVGSALSNTAYTLSDGTDNDNLALLNFTDLSTVLGDLAITYTDPSTNASPGISQQGNASNELQNVSTAIILNLDSTNPTISTATNPTTSTTLLTTSENVQINANVATDFSVTDGKGQTFAVSALTNNGMPNGNNLLLTMAALDGVPAAVGDITVTYTRTSSQISDFGFNDLLTGASLVIDRDMTAPTYTSASYLNDNQLQVTFSEDVQTNGGNPTDFTVTDGAGNSYTVFDQSDATPGDANLTLLTNSLTNALGDLTVGYQNNNNEVSDFGSNIVQFGSAAVVTQTIDRDMSVPTITDISVANNTQLTVTFSEPIVPANEGTLTTGFIVVDQLSAGFAVTGQADGTVQDNQITLTIADISSSVGDLTVTYTDATAGVNRITDFGGNNVQDLGGFNIERTFTGTPTLTENAVTTASPDVAMDDLALFRTDAGVGSPAALTPVTIDPVIDGSLVTIYSDEALTSVVLSQNVTGTLSPTLTQFMSGSAIDFSGNDDNGIFTFYITETSVGGSVTSRGPAVEYSIAFMDDSEPSQLVFSSSNTTGTAISVQDPLNQSLIISGNGLSSFNYQADNTAGASTVQFVPSAAGNGSHPVNFRWQNDDGNAATINPFTFTVITASDVFGSAQTDLNFCKDETIQTIELNRAPTDVDVNGTEVGGNPDFYGIEVYVIENGNVRTSVGVAGVANATGGNIASSVLTYSGSAVSFGTPTDVIDGGMASVWQFNPSGFTAGLGATSGEVDTLRFATIITPDNASDLSNAIVLNTQDVLLFPDPTVTIEAFNATTAPDGLKTQYCEDDATFDIRARVFTYNGDGGIDTTGIINNGYTLLYYGSDATYTTLQASYDFTEGGGNEFNDFNPADPDRGVTKTAGALAGSDISPTNGYYRISYTGVNQTDGGCDPAAVTADFQIVASPTTTSVFRVESQSGTTTNITSQTDFKFCDDDALNSAAASTADNIPDEVNAIEVSGAVGSTFTWYDDSGLTNEITVADAQGDRALSSELGIFIPAGDSVNYDFFVVERNSSGCDGNALEINVTVYARQETPSVSGATVLGDSVIVEFCQGATLSNLEMTNSLISTDADSSIFNYYLENGTTNTPLTTAISSALLNTDAQDRIVSAAEIVSQFGVNTSVVDTINIWVSQTDFGIASVGSDLAFSGCESQQRKISFITVGNASDIITTDSNFETEYFICDGETIGDIEANDNATGILYRWYRDTDNNIATFDGGTAFLEAPSLENDDLVGSAVTTAHNLDGSVIAGGQAYANTTTTGVVYYYWVTRVNGNNDDTGFEGCESSATLISITVFPGSAEPGFQVNSGAVNNVVANNSINVDYELWYDVEQINGTNGNTAPTFTAVLNGFANGAFTTSATSAGSGNAANVIHQFNWYSSDATGARQTQTFTGATATPSNLGLTSTTDATVYIYLEQVTNIVQDGNSTPNTLFTGCESNGVVIKFNIFARPAAPTGTTSYFYCEGVTVADLTMNGTEVSGGTPLSTYTWMDVNNTTLNTESGDASGNSVGDMDAELGIGNTPVDSLYTVKVVQTTDATNAVTETGATGLNLPFAGATSDTTTITINVREVPAAVSITGTTPFCDNGDATQLNIPFSANGDTYRVYESDGTTLRTTLGASSSQIPVTLSTASTGVSDRIFITQLTDTNLDASFAGCESAQTAIDIHPFPALETFTGTGNLFVNEACDDGDINVNLNVTNLNTRTVADYTAVWSIEGTQRASNSGSFNLALNDPTISGTAQFDVTVTDNTTNCATTITERISIGASPKPVISVSNVTQGALTNILVTDSVLLESQMRSVVLTVTDSISGASILSQTLTGDVTAATGYDGLVQATLPSTSIYKVSALATSTSGCTDTEPFVFTIIPQVTVTSDTTISFDAGSNISWYSEPDRGRSITTNSWEIGPAAGVGFEMGTDSQGGNSTIVATNLNGVYGQDEVSYVYSPSFDITNLSLPAVRFFYYSDMVNAADGVVFQFSTDDGTTWNVLGEFPEGETQSTGRNWYSNNGVTAQISVQNNNVERVAWAADNEEWLQAVHPLSGENLPTTGLTNIRFRFALASRNGDKEAVIGGATELAEGFAFDRFTLFSREKITMVETFSSVLDGNSVSANSELSSALVNQNLLDEVLWVNYFTDLANTNEFEDPIHASRPNSPNARSSFYSVQDVPRVALGGQKAEPNENGGSEIERAFGITTRDIQEESLDDPEFSITGLSANIADDQLNLAALFTATGTVTDLGLTAESELSVRLMVMQSEIDAVLVDLDESFTKPTVYQNVVRAIMPGPEGEIWVGERTSGDQLPITAEWTISGIWGTPGQTVELRVVAFIQNELDKEIYQVASTTVDYTLPQNVTSIGNEFFEVGSTYDIYPNPSDKYFAIRLAAPTKEDLNWSLYDQAGRMVESGQFSAGQSEIAVDARELKSGMYLLKLYNQVHSWESQRVIIVSTGR